MNCDEVAALLAADADGEVDGLRSHALRKHVAGCPQCTQRHEAATVLRQRLRAELTYHVAPAALRVRLQAEHGLPASSPAVPGPLPVRRWGWFGGGVLAGGLATGLVWVASLAWQAGGVGQDLSERAVGLHTRATLGNRLIEVASSDRHTVKPWLSARLDYAIPVADWSSAGFALQGARIEALDGRPTATLVYRHRDHVIDVFVRPDATAAAASSVHAVRGFNVAAAQGAQMTWLATSDLNAADLTAFVQGLARGAVEPAAE